MQFNREAKELKAELVAWRRDFHQHPELGFEEERTGRIVAEKLQEWGYEVTRMAKTGVVGLLRGAGGGKTLAFRADMDALPLTEKSEAPYRSKIEGKMHACGHDAHTTIALGTAKLLAAHREELKGNVKFIFQPAEEGPGGAKPMIEEGVLKDPEVDRIVGLHVFPELEAGKIGIKKGAIMAAPDLFEITIKGEGAHGAHPEQSVDPIFIGSQLVMALQGLVSRENDPQEPVVLTCGTFHSGSNFNIIPDEAEITGTVRTFDEDLRRKMRQRIEEVTAGITGSFNADYDLNYVYEYPPTINEDKITELVMQVLQDMDGDRLHILEKPSMGGEDFAFFLEEVPGTYMFLGSTNPEEKITPIHTPDFDLDESILPLGVEVFCRLAFNYLNT